ncbi:KTSC domain-containing protein [Mucilaginibacter conchicola]|uniref:KTSC domain-containing protein n=1 Tax=Mucilaginibacter conchicola TaxID=2303333 RepID=A0A372NNQ3_9SPHI|nr:KTSC domain-containing protein [Mucilaginibacter conchicola]RFZ90572.1 KTSC domain-containing protein [Mucilaginibacter conchicola]
MRRHKVESSALESIGYDAGKQILELEFRDNHSVWQYFGIRPSTYRKFISAESLGRYFVKRIKGRYPELKLI